MASGSSSDHGFSVNREVPVASWLVHLEHHRSGVFLYDEGDVTAYKIASAAIRRAALSPEDSAAFITDVVNEMERQE